mmetsp:Transcript_20749/g.58224  ORF Transcript_20749/g.58224 Transcript_20749/m.58224 type:complete len:259 (+) Transcript_20749:77-853(+)
MWHGRPAPSCARLSAGPLQPARGSSTSSCIGFPGLAGVSALGSASAVLRRRLSWAFAVAFCCEARFASLFFLHALAMTCWLLTSFTATSFPPPGPSVMLFALCSILLIFSLSCGSIFWSAMSRSFRAANVSLSSFPLTHMDFSTVFDAERKSTMWSPSTWISTCLRSFGCSVFKYSFSITAGSSLSRLSMSWKAGILIEDRVWGPPLPPCVSSLVWHSWMNRTASLNEIFSFRFSSYFTHVCSHTSMYHASSDSWPSV